MPRMIELIRASAVPSNLVQSAAKGALAVPAPEMLEILVHLAIHNKVFGEQARLTLAGWDEKASLTAAADPNAPPEVLQYMVSPENLRSKLFPALVENPAISEEALLEFAATGSRGVVDCMMKSERVQGSPSLLTALRSNPNITGIELQAIREKLPETNSPAPKELAVQPVDTDDILSDKPLAVGSEEDLDPEVVAYLTEHAAEIEAEGDKPFHAIGGVYDELLEPEHAASPAPPVTVTAETGPAAAAAAIASPVHKKTMLSHEEERGSALQKISKLDIKGRIQLAMKGTKEERSILIRDGTKLVALSVLESPKISESEAERFAAQKNVLEAVLRGIPMKRRFAKHYPTVRNLVFNPRTPLDVSLGLMKNILPNDLRALAANKEVSDTIRKLAHKMFKAKADPGKRRSAD